MKDSIRTPMGRSLSWLAIWGSLVCLAGCAGLNGPTQSPAEMFSQSAAPASNRVRRQVRRHPVLRQLVLRQLACHRANSIATGPAPSYAAPGIPNAPTDNTIAQTAATEPYVARQYPTNTPAPGYNFASPAGPPLPPGSDFTPPANPYTGLPDPYAPVAPYANYQPGPRVREADLVINGFPARTGRIMLGGAVNSDAGVTGQLTVDERNFDISRWPTSFQDLFSGTAFRGAGQTFRIEAAPGTDFKRYTTQFADPNLFGYKPVSMSVSGFLFDRRYNDWSEERLGGRLAFGYRVTPDLSVSAGISGQNVRHHRHVRVTDVPQLDSVAR